MTQKISTKDLLKEIKRLQAIMLENQKRIRENQIAIKKSHQEIQALMLRPSNPFTSIIGNITNGFGKLISSFRPATSSDSKQKHSSKQLCQLEHKDQEQVGLMEPKHQDPANGSIKFQNGSINVGVESVNKLQDKDNILLTMKLQKSIYNNSKTPHTKKD